MDEEQIIELSQMAEEIADQGFENIDTILEEAINELNIDNIRVDVPEISVDIPLEGEIHQEEEASDRDFIAPNITTSVTEEVTSRFSSAEWFEKMKQQNIILAGLGGIGSWCSLLLGRCHPNSMIIFDDDTVEGVNMAGQLYNRQDIGRRKAQVSTSLLMSYCNYYTIEQYGRYDTHNHPVSNIMICGFDNMEARRFFYHKWKNYVNGTFTPENCLFIDGRLNAEEWQVFAIRGNDTYRMEQYEKEWLFEDDEVEEALCSYKQTSFCASMIASYMVNIFVNFVANMCDPIIERDIPFLTEYDAKTMYLKTIQ